MNSDQRLQEDPEEVSRGAAENAETGKDSNPVFTKLAPALQCNRFQLP